jgi:hypothetical protein
LKVLHAYMKSADQEIWCSFKGASTSLSTAVTMLIFVELLVIGIFIVPLHAVVNFMQNRFMKFGKI